MVTDGWQGCRDGREPRGVSGQVCQQLSSGWACRTPARHGLSVWHAPCCYCLFFLAQIQGCSDLRPLPSPTSLSKEQGEAGLGARLGGMVAPGKLLESWELALWKLSVCVAASSQQKGWEMTAEQATAIHLFDSGQPWRLGKIISRGFGKPYLNCPRYLSWGTLCKWGCHCGFGTCCY